MYPTLSKLSEFKFVGKISDSGKNQIIWIPKQYHEAIKPLKKRYINIILKAID